MLEHGTYFVGGIDTDAGKSYATGLLARMLCEQGLRVITQKLVQTGATAEHYDAVQSEDVLLHRRLMGLPLQPEDITGLTCTQVFRHPCSPHLAAALEGREVNLERIAEATALLRERHDIVLIEGAGGLLVPLREGYLTADYVADRRLPLLLATSSRLGSLSHTLLSLEACRTRHIRVAGVLFNHYPASDPLIAEDTRRYIVRHIGQHHPGSQLIDIPIHDEPR